MSWINRKVQQPEDKQYCLVYVLGGIKIMMWDAQFCGFVHHVINPDEEPIKKEDGSITRILMMEVVNPSHWMPLPAPPK